MPRAPRARFALRRALDSVHPAAGAAAMATGILSDALGLVDFEVLSLVWLAVGGAIWVLLLAVVVVRLFEVPRRWGNEADTPAALTAVAATSVLGARVALLGWNVVAAVALVVSVAAWLALIPAVLEHWRSPATGAHFLLSVATQGLAVLGATLAWTLHARWLGLFALGPFALGLAFYLLVAARFSWRELRVGAGDQWILVGALAIGALAAGRLTYASAAIAWGAVTRHLTLATFVLLVVTLAGYAPLTVAEARWPRPRFDVRRWATAFPLGMTASASLTAAHLGDAEPFHATGVVLVVLTVALCAVLLVGWGRHIVEAGTGG